MKTQKEKKSNPHSLFRLGMGGKTPEEDVEQLEIFMKAFSQRKTELQRAAKQPGFLQTRIAL